MIVLLIRALLVAAETVNDPGVMSTAWAIAQQVVAFVIALGALYVTVLRPVARAMGRHFRAAIAEIAAGQQATADVLERVEHQVKPNGGKSAHDYARKAYELGEHTAVELRAIRAEQRHHSERLDMLQGEMTAAGWRQQELATKFTERDTAGREALVLFREALAEQGITLPIAPTEEVVSNL